MMKQNRDKKLRKILENLAGVGKDCKPRMTIDRAMTRIIKLNEVGYDEIFDIVFRCMDNNSRIWCDEMTEKITDYVNGK